MEKTINLTNFSGGISDQQKRGLVGSARFLKNLNPHEDDAYLVPTPKLAKVSGSTVGGLVKWAVDGAPGDTNKYFYADDGKIYKQTSGGVWSLDHTVPTSLDDDIADPAAGQGMAIYDDYLFFASSIQIGRKGPLSVSSTYRDSYFGSSIDTSDQSATGTGQTYTTPVAISETAANRFSFTPERDSLYSVVITIAAVGTGNWTVTVHDSLENTICSVTKTNGELAAEATFFSFDPQGRVTIGDTYHVHVTSTVADGTVTTGTTANLSTAGYTTYFGTLIADSDFHPMISHLNQLVIGNERYAAVWDGATYNPNHLVFEPGFKVRSLTKIDEFLVFGCWRGSNVDSTGLGKLYFWDGIAPTFNFSQDVPVGVVNALANHRNTLLGVYGSSGKVYQGSEEFKELWKVPKLARGKKIEVFPGAVTNWQGQTMLGIGANTDDSSGIEQGVYALGSQDGDHQDVFTLAHTISTGTTQGTGLEIGCVAAFGADLYVGWKDGSTYGVDKVSKTSNANTSGSYESLIIDAGNPHKEKLAYDVVVEFEDLESGESITPKYQLDRSGSFTTGTTVSTVGANRASVLLNRRFKEAEIGFNYATSTTFPKITSLQFNYNDLSEEGRSDR